MMASVRSRTRRGRLQRLVTVLLAVVTLSAGLLAGAPVSADVPDVRPVVGGLHLRLPAPTGVSPVGVISAFATDPTRPEPATGGVRTLPVQIWYPARHHGRASDAAYFSPPVQQVIEDALALPGLFNVRTHATTGARPRRDSRGVVLLSGGYGTPAAFQTGQAVDLASHGWTVVAFDHPHDTFVVEQPDGTLIFGEPEDIEADFVTRVRDVGVVLGHLPTLVPAWRRGLPVGMFGFSLGGATAAEAMRQFPRLRAGVDLDGTPFGEVVETGLDRPFGFLLGEDHSPANDPSLAMLLSRLTGPHPVRQYDVQHWGFTDFAVFVPHAAAADAAVGAALEEGFPTGVSSVAEGGAVFASQRAFLASFFRRYLRLGHDWASPPGPPEGIRDLVGVDSRSSA